jgi:thiamine-phosphate pyrophosphorylase
MPIEQQRPITYLITNGETTPQTIPADKDFSRLLNLVAAAVAAHINLIQIREKNLSTRVLYDLTLEAVELTRGSNTRLLINDRADVARSAGAAGVHLTAGSIETSIIRRTFGDDFLIGVSTHSLEEARAARGARADFAVFGPVFETASKRVYGEPLGLEQLTQVTTALTEFPVLALGGVTLDNVAGCFRAGAAGVAAIRLMNDPNQLAWVVAEIGARFRSQTE